MNLDGAPEDRIRRRLPLYLEARADVASLPSRHADYADAIAHRDALARLIALDLSVCQDRTLVVKELGIRVSAEADTGDLWIAPLPRRKNASNLPGPWSRLGASEPTKARVRRADMSGHPGEGSGEGRS